jgi:hypothetical protein
VLTSRKQAGVAAIRLHVYTCFAMPRVGYVAPCSPGGCLHHFYRCASLCRVWYSPAPPELDMMGVLKGPPGGTRCIMVVVVFGDVM